WLENVVMISITCSQLTNQPMYFFLSYLAVSDLFYTFIVTVKLLSDLLTERKPISYKNCMTQLLTTYFFGTEIFILTGMAYDLYVAICKPLHYAIVMNRQRCNSILTASCAGGLLIPLVYSFCSPNQIDHCFCNVYPLLKLACTDTERSGFLVIAKCGTMGLVVFMVLISYIMITSNFRAYSAESCSKAPFTCSSHITVVIVSFTCHLYLLDTASPEDKMVMLFYTIIIPMLDSLIYMLRNMEMKISVKLVKNAEMPQYSKQRP
uniref:G-protein coupled receptors family 1 profile domain-containing protein n=1 Tax=Loxodonta africana TaxID=9785 RepID=G3UDK6_LOXAF